MNVKVGMQVFLLYVGLYYFIPVVFGVFYDFSYLDYLDGNPNYYFAPIYIVFYLLVFLFLYIYIPHIKIPFKKIEIKFFFSPYAFFLVSCFFLLLSYKFFNEYGFQYRHKGDPISESSSYIKILLFLRMLVNIYLIYLLSAMSFSYRVSRIDVINLLLIGSGIVLSLTTSFDVVIVFFILLLLIYHFFNINFLFNENRYSISKNILSFGFLLLVVLSVLFFGVANKIGAESAFSYLAGGGLWGMLEVILQRLSIFFYSTAYLIEYNLFNSDLQLNSLAGNLDNFSYRINVLLDTGVSRPDLASTARVNSELIYANPNERNGAAPGLIGSSIFLPFFPLNIFVSALYVVITVKIIDSLFAVGTKLKFIPCFFVMTIFQVLVDAQPDVVNLLSLTFIQYCLLMLLWLNRVKG